jgi:hypothetical protein
MSTDMHPCVNYEWIKIQLIVNLNLLKMNQKLIKNEIRIN